MKKDHTLVFMLATAFCFPFYWLAMYKAFSLIVCIEDGFASAFFTTILTLLPFIAIIAGISTAEEKLKDK